MSSKENSRSQQGQTSQLKSQASQKTKKSLLKDKSNHNLKINTSIDQIRKQDVKLKKEENSKRQIFSQQMADKSDLHQQKVDNIKLIKHVEKEQKQAHVVLQKSGKKLPNIGHQSPGNKQNHQEKLVKKNQPLTVHNGAQNSHYENISKSKKNSSQLEENYSLINGRKVYMSEDDVTKLRKLKIQYQKREQQIKKKVVAHDLFIQQMKTEEIMSKEKRIQEQRQKRLKSIEERQKILSKERQQRLGRYQEENRKLKELKKSKKLFEKLEQDFHKIQQKQKLNLDEMIKSRVGQGTVNFDQIKQHEKQYLERSRQNIENSRIRIKSKIKQMEEQFNHLNLHKSQFYQRVKNEKKQILQQMEENEKRRKVCSQKMKEYREVVRENYMPSVFKVQKPEEPKKHRYNYSQIHSMGNEYMKQGGKLIDRNKSLNLLEKIQKQEAEKTSKTVYKNYLHENRAEKSPQYKSKSKSKTEEALMERELNSINVIKNAKQKYEKIKILHNKIQKDLKSSMQIGGKIKLKSGMTTNLESQTHIKQIKAKLQLLERLES